MNEITRKQKKHVAFSARLFLGIILFILCITLGLVFFFKSLYFVSEEKVNYSDKSNLDYIVHLKENNFYDEKYLGKDMAYVASLIDKVNVTFNYNFVSDINLDLDLKYSIIGRLVIQEPSGNNNYFEKNYTLIDEKIVTLNKENKKNIAEVVEIDYDNYNNIANSFKSQYGVDAVSKFTVYLLINKDSTNEDIILSDFDTMSIEIPLSERSINIEMDYNEINNTSEIISKSKISIDNIVYIIMSITLLLLSLIIVVNIIRLLNLIIPKKSKYDKYVKKLLTEYDRMISETETMPVTSGVEIIEIGKFTELVDIRDNLRLPIMYYSITEHQKAWFYIKHNKKMYLHVVKAIDLEEKK